MTRETYDNEFHSEIKKIPTHALTRQSATIIVKSPGVLKSHLSDNLGLPSLPPFIKF